MEKWQWISLLLCAFGFFKEFRPSEPFVTEYLISHKNFTKETIVQVAYPIATYTYLGTLPIVFLITDFLRYKSVVIFEGLAFIVTYTLLIWGNGLTNLKMVEILYGISSSTEVAYYTYIYAKVDKEHYKKVTSYTYTAILIGNFVAAAISQLLVSSSLMDYHELNYLTLSSVSVAFVLSCFLPSVQESIYFYRNDKPVSPSQPNDDAADETRKINLTNQKLTFLQRIRQAYPILWTDCRNAYSNWYVLKWSIWWAIASAGFLQVINFIQALWETIESHKDAEHFNGAVDATHTLLSAGLALGVGYVAIPWFKWGETVLCIISLVQGTVLMIMSSTGSLFVSYVGYVIFRTMYQVMITVATAEVAQGISADSYGLIFGINRFMALSCQTVLTLVLADEKGLALNERDQFLVYGCYFIVLGVMFLFVAAITFFRLGCSSSNNNYRHSRETSLGNLPNALNNEDL